MKLCIITFAVSLNAIIVLQLPERVEGTVFTKEKAQSNRDIKDQLAHSLPSKSKTKQLEEEERLRVLKSRRSTTPSPYPSLKRQDSGALNELLIVIFGDYHKELVPKRPTFVKLDLLLIKVKSTNEREGIFETVVALFIEWKDERLMWNPHEYANTTVLAFDSDKVWLPDIAMTNSADHLYSISKDTRFVVRVSHDGTMKFVPTGTARTWCELKLLTFPFDIQTCSFEFESWSLDSSTMTFNQSSDALVDDAFASPQWTLCQHRSTVYDYFYEFSGENFTRVRFDFVVRRKSTFYIINLIFPTATLSLIQLLVFAIPSTDASSDRVAFGTTNLLTLVVFQTIITEEMPKSSDSVTALSKYIIALIIVSALGILESVAAERLLRPTTTPPPKWVIDLRLPLLWGTQLPTGIAQLVLNNWTRPGAAQALSEMSLSTEDTADEGAGDEDDRKAPRLVVNPPSDESSPMKREPSIVIEYEDDDSISQQGGCCGNRSAKTKVSLRKKSDNSGFGNLTQVLTQAAQAASSKKQIQAPLNTKRRSSEWSESNYERLPHDDSPPARPPPSPRSPKVTTFAQFGEVEDPYIQLPNCLSEDQNRLGPNLAPKASSIHSSINRRKSSSNSKSAIIAATVAAKSAANLAPLLFPLPLFGNTRQSSFAAQRAVRQSMQQASSRILDDLELIEIGRAWGAIVTRLDGLTFTVCASLAIFLPMALFLPLALMEQNCGVYASQM